MVFLKQDIDDAGLECARQGRTQKSHYLMIFMGSKHVFVHNGAKVRLFLVLLHPLW